MFCNKSDAEFAHSSTVSYLSHPLSRQRHPPLKVLCTALIASVQVLSTDNHKEHPVVVAITA